MRTFEQYKCDHENVISKEKIKCPICNKESGNLVSHFKSHKVSAKEAKEKYGNIAVYPYNTLLAASNKEARKKASNSIKIVAKNKRDEIKEKRQKTWIELQPRCRVCNDIIKFSKWYDDETTFCGKLKCRHSICRENSLKQDKTKIGDQIRASSKWRQRTTETLQKLSPILEQNILNALSLLYKNVVSQKLIEFDNKIKFADIYISSNDVYIEYRNRWPVSFYII
jgi:hypothetical protein